MPDERPSRAEYEADGRAQPVAVAARADEPHHEVVAGRLRPVEEDLDRLVQARHDGVDPAVVVEVPEGRASMQAHLLEVRPALAGDVAERPVAEVPEDPVRLS